MSTCVGLGSARLSRDEAAMFLAQIFHAGIYNEAFGWEVVAGPGADFEGVGLAGIGRVPIAPVR